MIDITSFFLKHLYEFMADNYNATTANQQQQQQRQRQNQQHQRQQQEPESDEQVVASSLASESQQIVSFLINNQLPDLACETLIELIFICVFLAISWILVMIIQLHCHQSSSQSLVDVGWPDADAASSSSSSPTQHPSSSYLYARDYYCNTKFLNSLMYCNNHNSLAVSS